MDTLIIQWKDISYGIKVLSEGEALAFPTETVYGLGIAMDKESNFRRLVALKRRPPEKPFTIMSSSLAYAANVAQLDARMRGIMKKYLPGPLTVLLPKRPHLPYYLTLGLPSIGYRVPDDKNVIDMIDKVGVPLLVPSANPSDLPPALNVEEAYRYFRGQIPYIVEGNIRGGKPSTIVDLSAPGEIKLVREGPIPFDEIKATFDTFVAPTIAIGSDHGGFAYKQALVSFLKEEGYQVMDVDTDSEESCDYPKFALKVAQAVASKNARLGIVICTSGIGVSIVANKVPGIRCALAYDDVVAGKAREHNNANVIAFGQKYMALEDVYRRVDIFLTEKFSRAEKHHRRVKEIENISL